VPVVDDQQLGQQDLDLRVRDDDVVEQRAQAVGRLGEVVVVEQVVGADVEQDDVGRRVGHPLVDAVGELGDPPAGVALVVVVGARAVVLRPDEVDGQPGLGQPGAEGRAVAVGGRIALAEGDAVAERHDAQPGGGVIGREDRRRRGQRHAGGQQPGQQPGQEGTGRPAGTGNGTTATGPDHQTHAGQFGAAARGTERGNRPAPARTTKSTRRRTNGGPRACSPAT
jgi:hypothetical protein